VASHLTIAAVVHLELIPLLASPVRSKRIVRFVGPSSTSEIRSVPLRNGRRERPVNVRWVEVPAKVLTVSDSVAAGLRVDLSGDAIEVMLQLNSFIVVERDVVADGVTPVAEALVALSSSFPGLLVTTGGTGFSPTDLTPEGTRKVIDREAPGMAEAMRAASALGPLSRGIAGTLGSCLILNLPGSVKGSTESLAALMGVLHHALDLLAGGEPH
jgi:molybdopterin adenylyltransferase